MFEPGSTVGRYLILDVLGSGGMSVVYGAYDPQLDRRVALKLMRTTRDGRDQQHVRDRLLREAQALARLAHPNVVTVHDVGTVADQVFVAMEYVEGQTLTDWLGTARALADVVQVFLAAGEGLAAAHSVGLVHRDFKPDNVMIDAQGRVRVMDFGLARPSGSPSSDLIAVDVDSEVMASHTGDASFSGDALATPLTVTGAVMGTPAYMAPEQHAGGRTGPATDQFSFCVTLHEALYGLRPFGGETRAELQTNVMHGRRCEPPRGRRIPRRLRRTIERGLSVHPLDRWPSMAALLGQLDRVPWIRRRRTIVAAAGLGGIALVGLSPSPDATRAEADACASALDLAGVWDRSRRDDLDEGLGRDAGPWANEAWPALAQRLDDHAGRWQQAHDELCSTNAGGSPRQLACLAEQREQLMLLTTTLESGDAAALGLAHEQLARLGAPQACVEQEAGAVGPESVDAERVAELRRDLARVPAAVATGDHDAALAASATLVRTAEALGHPRMLAEVWALRGQALAAAGRWTRAESALEQAWSRSIAAGHDRVAASVAIEMVQVTDAQGRSRDAQGWARDAEAFVSRGDRDPLLQARLYLAQAKPLGHTGRFDEARLVLQQAAALRVDVLGPRAPAVAQVEVAMAQLEHRAGDGQAAVAHYRRAQALLKEGLSKGSRQAADVELDLGGALVDAGMSDEGDAVLTGAMLMLHDAYGNTHPRLADALLEVARRRGIMREFVDAHHALNQAEGIIKGADEPDPLRLAAVQYQRGVLLLHQDKAAEAESWLTTALAATERVQGLRHWRVAAVLDVLGRAMASREQPATALLHHGRAESIWRAQRPDSIELARCLVLQGAAQLANDHPEVAAIEVGHALEILEHRVPQPELEAHARLLRAEALVALDPTTDLARREAYAAAALLKVAVNAEPSLHEAVEGWIEAHDSEGAAPAGPTAAGAGRSQ